MRPCLSIATSNGITIYHYHDNTYKTFANKQPKCQTAIIYLLSFIAAKSIRLQNHPQQPETLQG
jgi:hypothetical protein